MSTRRSWTDAEDERLRHEWNRTSHRTLRGNPGRFDRDLAAELARSPGSVRYRRSQLGLVGPDLSDPWNPQQDAAIIAGHPDGDRVLAGLIGRSPDAIRTRRHVLRQQGTDIPRPAPARRTPRQTSRPTPKPDPAPESLRLPKGWYGPPGSDTAPGTRWIPGAKFRRTA